MAIVTTGSLVYGTVAGLKSSMKPRPAIFSVLGNPDGILQCVAGSDIAVDLTNGIYYIAKTGSTWYNLGSVAP